MKTRQVTTDKGQLTPIQRFKTAPMDNIEAGLYYVTLLNQADVAQLAEQLIRNQ